MTEAVEPYIHQVRVRYGEVDQQGVVFNSHYLAYCDDAVETWVRARGIRMTEHEWDFMLKKAVVEWQGSATTADALTIEVGVARWGKTSFDVALAGAVDGRPVFSCVITYVGVRMGTKETMPAPASVRAALGGS